MTPPPRDVRIVQISGCFALLLIFATLVLLPFLFLDLAHTALRNLHLNSTQATLVLVGLLIGSWINVPLTRIRLDGDVEVGGWQPIPGWSGGLYRTQRVTREMIVAVNVGGCVIPVLLAIHQLRYVLAVGGPALLALGFGTFANVAICLRASRIVPGLGIALQPFFLPALVALATGWLLVPAEQAELRASVAFVVGISGPLIGADLLRWPQFREINAPAVGIGGAGTWDGVVVSGLLAALFA